MSRKEDYGASHWSSKKVWERRMKRTTEGPANVNDAVDRVLQILDEKGLDIKEKYVVLARATEQISGPG